MNELNDPNSLLLRLNLVKVGNYLIRIKNIHRPKTREKECRYFNLHLEMENWISIPIVSGFFSMGRRSINLKSYFDIDFNNKFLGINDVEINLKDGRIDREIFNALSMLVEPGGKIIVSVASLHNQTLHSETFSALDRGFPPEITYIGELLFSCRCGSRFKNWLLREGGNEGAPSLQGEKAPNMDDYLEGIQNTVHNLDKLVTSNKVEFVEVASNMLREIKLGKIPLRCRNSCSNE